MSKIETLAIKDKNNKTITYFIEACLINHDRKMCIAMTQQTDNPENELKKTIDIYINI